MFKIFLLFLFFLWFVIYYVNVSSLVGVLFGGLESSMSEAFFLNVLELEGAHSFYFVYLFIFYSLLLSIIPFSVNEILPVIFYIAFMLWFTGFIFGLHSITFIEEGGALSSFMYYLAVVSVIVQPVTLSLRISVNLILGETLLFYIVFIKSSLILFTSLYEYFVVFLQSSVLFFLLFSYGRS